MRRAITRSGRPPGPFDEGIRRLDKAPSIKDKRRALFLPGALVGHGQRVEVAGRRGRIVDPFAQQRAAVDDVDGELAELVLVGEVAPQRIVGSEAADRLEGQRLQPPGPERLRGRRCRSSTWICTPLHSLPTCLWKVGSNQQSRSRQPSSHCGASARISAITRARVDVGRAEQLERPGRAAPFGQRRAFEHHRAGIGARHPQVGRVRAGVDPGALAQRPAVARAADSGCQPSISMTR